MDGRKMLKRILVCMPGVAGVLLLTGTAHGGVIMQTVSVPAQTLIASAPSGSNQVGLSSVFNQFDPTLGTLTDVQFNLNYNLQFSVTNGGGGFSISGPALVNGSQPSTSAGPAALGGGGGSGTFNVYNANDSSTTLDITSTFAPYTGNGTFTFDFPSSESFSVGGPPGSQGELNLLASSLTVNYTYVAAPEPTALAGIALLALALTRRARRGVCDGNTSASV
jgi:hypothetical protein